MKEERQQIIVEELNTVGFVSVSDLTDKMQVTEMTIRRDLKELEIKGLLKRIHGGAKPLDALHSKEISHQEKRKKNIDEKIKIAKIINSLIQEESTVFLGTGTTIELVAEFIKGRNIRVVTNSYYLFEKLAYEEKPDVILIGGTFRSKTGAFVGNFTNELLRNIRVDCAFIGANGIYENGAFDSNPAESEALKIIMDNARNKYIAVDYSKIGKEDFLEFYSLDEITALIVDENIEEKSKNRLSKLTEIITNPKNQKRV